MVLLFVRSLELQSYKITKLQTYEVTKLTKKQDTFEQKKVNFLDGIEFQNVDIWFPLLHGFNGEDGSIHGLLKFTNKPLVGCGILGSALGMDKILMLSLIHI